MRAAFILVAITACVLAAPSKSSLLARQIQCAAVDNDGSVLTSASASGASTVCTYAGAGACTYAADGILSGGDNSCPLGASATGATSATPTSADDNPHVPGTSTRSDDHPHSGTEDHRHGKAGIDDHPHTGTDDPHTGTDDQPHTGTDDHPHTGTDDHPHTGTDDHPHSTVNGSTPSSTVSSGDSSNSASAAGALGSNQNQNTLTGGALRVHGEAMAGLLAALGMGFVVL